MIKSFTIREKSLLSKILLFDKIELKQVTLLFGGNGVGKSSLIQGILKQRDIDYELSKPTTAYSYINSKQNFREMERNDHLSINDMYDPGVLARKFAAGDLSEGQSIIFSIQDIFDLCEAIDSDKDHIILLDEIDSGLSVDNVDYLARKIKRICKKHPNIQFVIAFNNYEFCRTFKDVFNMYNGEWVKINSYDEYFNLIKSNRNMLLKKRKRNMFTGNSNF